MQYLHDKQHYIDRYDLLTINECLDNIKMLMAAGKKMTDDPRMKKMPQEELDRNLNLMLSRTLFAIKGLRFKNKVKTIDEWIKQDKAKQDKQDNTPPPRIMCPDCQTPMVADDFRQLEDWPEDKPMRVLFIFGCPKCKRRLGAYDDGDIHESKPELCPKCGKELTVKVSRKKKVITTRYTCKNCGYSKKEILDLNKSDEEHKKWEAEQKEKEESDKKLLE
jgi:DNA-directed RNA polymerase subunit M/transcription elongation factor TFIIS